MDRVHAPIKKHKLEIRSRKNLAKLTGSAVRIKSKKPKGKKTMKENKIEVATPGFEPAPQLPPAKKMRFLTTRPRNHYSNLLLKYLSLPFTLFEPYGAVFIMNSKIQFEEK